MDENDPTDRWIITRAMLRIADTALLVITWIVVQAVFFPSQFFGGAYYQPATVWGVPSGMITYAVGVTGVVNGWLWIRRIARGEPEPESNDRFWWSRA